MISLVLTVCSLAMDLTSQAVSGLHSFPFVELLMFYVSITWALAWLSWEGKGM